MPTPPTKSRKTPANAGGPRASDADPDEGIVREFIWDLVSISTHLDDIRQTWARLLGVSGPQWLILMAIDDMSSGKGISVGEVSKKLRVNPTFVTAQTKMLEQSGFLKREVSATDARVVLMSLTDKARKEIAKLSARRKALNDFIFSDMSDRSLREIGDKLSLIRNRIEKASLQLNIGI